jgi:hypothetical protein
MTGITSNPMKWRVTTMPGFSLQSQVSVETYFIENVVGDKDDKLNIYIFFFKDYSISPLMVIFPLRQHGNAKELRGAIV